MSHNLPVFNLNLPDNGGDPGTWDTALNAFLDEIDAAFSGTSGHTHDGTDTQGPQLDHEDLLNIGTNTHADIDTHIADTTKHFTAASVAVEVSDKDAAGLNDTVDVAAVADLRIRGARSITDLGSGIVLVDVSPITGSTGTPQGVPSHLPSTSAPVAVTDYFNGVAGSPLSSSNWFVTAPQLVELVMSPTGAHFSQDLAHQGVATGVIVNRVKTQVPHSEVQRVTLHLCRIGTDAFVDTTTRFSIQLALMSSVYSGANLPSRLGFFFRIEVYKTGVTLYMDRTLFAVPTVLSNGLSQVVTLWSDSNPVSAATGKHYQGAHEFSLDRNHAFHYSYNNGPVNLGTAGNAGAATAYVTALRQSLMLEPGLLALGQLTPATQGGVAPHFGRFGFDLSWHIAANPDTSDINKIDATVEYFTATSTDDETAVYTAVLAEGDCAAAEPTPPAEPCCPDLNPTNTVGETLVLTLPAPYGGGGWGSGMPPALGGPPEPDVITAFRVTARIADGDPTYGYAGFLLRRLGEENNPDEPTHVVYCAAPSDVEIEIIEPPRPGTREAVIAISGARIPSLVGRPVFYPADPSTALASTGSVPPGAGAYPQPIPYPVPGQPGALLGSSSAVVAAGAWDAAVPVDDSVVSNIRWYRDVADGSLVIKFDVGDGLPYGSALDVEIPFLIHPADGITTVGGSLASRIILHPPKPEWVASKFFRRDSTGAWDRVTDVPDLSHVYLVAYGRRLPLPIVQENDTTPTLWGGFPVDVDASAVVASKFVVIDADTGLAATDVTVESIDMWKGWYDLEDTDFPASAEFPPTGNSPVSLLGETVFVHLSLAGDIVGKQFILRAVETEDPALPPADLYLPPVTGATPVIYGITASTTDADAAADFTVSGAGFVDVAVTVTAGASSSPTSVLTSVDGTEVTFSVADLGAAGTVTFRVRNYAGAGAYDEFSIVVDSALPPAISGVSPGSFVEGTVSQHVVVSGDASTFDPGALLTIQPDVPVTVTVHSVALTTGAGNKFDVYMDIPVGAPYNIDFTVTNPNGDTSSTSSIAVAAPSAPTVSALTFYPIDDYGGATNAQGKERGAKGWIKITGTNFRNGATVTTDFPELVIIGEVTRIGATEMKVGYEIGGLATVGETVTVTYTDPNGTSSASDTFDIESRTPVITLVNIMNPHEGAGVAGTADGSAHVYISGKHFFEDGAAAVTDVDSGGAASPITFATDVSVVDDNLIIVHVLTLPANTAGQTASLIVSVGSKTATYSFEIQNQPKPQITGWQVFPGGPTALDPIVVEYSATGYDVVLYGAALSTEITSADLTVDGVSLTTTPTISSPNITFASTTFPGSATDPTVYAELTLAGGDVVSLPLFELVSAVGGTPTISEVNIFDVVESTRGGSIEIIGTDLGPSNVSTVTLEATTPDVLPLSVAPGIGTNEPISVQIISQTSEKIVIGVVASDLLGFTDGACTFDLKFYGPDGSDVSDVVNGTAVLIVEAFVDRPKFAVVVPAIDTTAGNTNTLEYDLVTVDEAGNVAAGADGGEYIEVVRHATVISTQALTGGLVFSSGADTIVRATTGWDTEGYRAGDYIVITDAEDTRNNGTFKIATIGGAGNKTITVETGAPAAGYPDYTAGIPVANAADTSAVVSLSPIVAHKVLAPTGATKAKVTFDNPAIVGAECEVRLVSRDGRILDVRRFTTT